ncbi:MAG: MFS transporter [Pseudomonadaceae bacterium]|nr:MFS transporter [Pseudomonadaceae bacterium]
MSASSPTRAAPVWLLLTLVVLSTTVGLAGTDLVLPAVPSLPDFLGGTVERSQLVLATFSFGSAIGFICFGELGARMDSRWLLVASLLGFAILSATAASTTSLDSLIGQRFFQGLFAAAPAVFGPGIIRSLLDERGALRAMGLLGSIESIVPALAPILGYWLLITYNWQASFQLTAVLAGLLSVCWLAVLKSVPSRRARGAEHGYRRLVRNTEFLRFAGSQAFTLGGLLIFVFGAPAVITTAMDGSLSDFVTMQVLGISFFIVAANLADRLVARFGSEETIKAGSLMSAVGLLLIVGYAVVDGANPKVLWPLFLIVNLGLGVRGPPGFYRAIVASGDDDARGAALVMLFILFIAAAGTAIAAPFISIGLAPLAIVACVTSWLSVALLYATNSTEKTTKTSN